ncbi:Pex14p [Kluyveromyces lactis]|uniref:Peroxisomal membrane protein PEX14 n=1 Tax=Kluyveromyces lactis (strain ATCC 8585 / CBS 2359 / DSM 70799 / NBRC 1267 / NRRL Y-1140 / WM37) TaxID=284590 RepID=Q6CNY6_KLULA|nr:uncharacterized protein KLLA0_E08955g [Kluyveromyces lactis]CAG99440.1 KLLA0E08955p [Kluyveromyces lactis]|eukprot:XP_454353.1 uncharacterized protein KLLA0_E08955g [Kluyveromyces lactis]
MSGEIPQDRRELYDSAISFLKDPNVVSAPLTQKIEFLQGKGLTQDEIQLALKDATGGSKDESKPVVNSDNTVSRESSNSHFHYEAVPPAIPNRDWKDYFIMATASVGLFYGVYQLTKRYIVPQLLPEPKSKLEKDKELILEQFDKVEKLLSQIEQEHEEFKTKEENKLEELDRTIIQLQSTLDDTTKLKQHMESEFSSIKTEFNNMQNSIDSFTKKAGNEKELEKVQEELQSLKSLIKSSFNPASAMNNGNTGGNSLISPNSTGMIPGADSIPSAADILANMDLQKKSASPPAGSLTNGTDTKAVPAWKKAREENGSKSATPTSSIPEWQKTMNTGNSYESN